MMYSFHNIKTTKRQWAQSTLISDMRMNQWKKTSGKRVKRREKVSETVIERKDWEAAECAGGREAQRTINREWNL